MNKKLLNRLAWTVGLVGLPILGMVEWHYHLAGQVSDYKKNLIAQGERLDPTSLVPPRPPGLTNHGPELVTRARSLDFSDEWPVAMKFIAPGKAELISQTPFLPLPKEIRDKGDPAGATTNQWQVLRQEVVRNETTLENIRSLVADGTLYFPQDYNQILNLRVPHLVPLKKAGAGLTHSTLLALHEGRLAEASRDLRTSLALVRRYEGEPLLISQLVRSVMAQMAFGVTWEALQTHGWNEESLRGMQEAWEGIELGQDYVASMPMERCLLVKALEEGRRSLNAYNGLVSLNSNQASLMTLDELMDQVTQDPAQALQQVMVAQPRYRAWRWWWSYQEELQALQSLQGFIQAVRGAVQPDIQYGRGFQQLSRLEQKPQSTHFHLDYNNSLSMFSNSVYRVGLIGVARDLSMTAIALERYRVGHRTYPEALAQLVPTYLAAPPRDCLTGQPLHYKKKTTHTFTLYSLGLNGKDDNGNSEPPSPQQELSPILSTRWMQGPDLVWPEVATAAEIEAARVKKK